MTLNQIIAHIHIFTEATRNQNFNRQRASPDFSGLALLFLAGFWQGTTSILPISTRFTQSKTPLNRAFHLKCHLLIIPIQLSKVAYWYNRTQSG